MNLKIQIIKKILILTGGFFFSVFIAEIVLRIFWTPPYLDSRFVRDDLKWTRENVVLNRFGYRDIEFDLTGKQKYRIYSLGDSYTYGWYINNLSDTYPKLLEKNLNDKYNQGVEVINASRPGFNLKDSVERLESEGLVFSPDLVTLGINIFDITDKSFTPQYIKNELVQNSRLYHLTFGNLERVKAAAAVNNLILETYRDDSPQLKKAQEQLSKMKGLTDSIGAKLVLIIFPSFSPENPNQPYKYIIFHNQIKKLSDKLRIEVVDLYDSFSLYKDKRDLVLNPTDPHPSISALRLTANMIVQKLDFNKLLSGPRVTSQIISQTIYPGLKLPSYHGIVSLEPSNWVFFNTAFGENTQRLLLPKSNDRRTPYLADTLKTAKAFTHEGWTGAKIEYNLLGGKKTLIIPLNLYGFKVTGISQVTAFWENKKALNSIDLPLSEVSIKKDERNIIIDIKNNKEFSLYRVTVDIAVSQFGITEGVIGDIFATKVYQEKLGAGQAFLNLSFGSKVGSLPRYVKSGEGVGYVWADNELTDVEFERKDKELKITFKTPKNTDTLLEIPLPQKEATSQYPTVFYK